MKKWKIIKIKNQILSREWWSNKIAIWISKIKCQGLFETSPLSSPACLSAMVHRFKFLVAPSSCCRSAVTFGCRLEDEISGVSFPLCTGDTIKGPWPDLPERKAQCFKKYYYWPCSLQMQRCMVVPNAPLPFLFLFPLFFYNMVMLRISL